MLSFINNNYLAIPFMVFIFIYVYHILKYPEIFHAGGKKITAEVKKKHKIFFISRFFGFISLLIIVIIKIWSK